MAARNRAPLGCVPLVSRTDLGQIARTSQGGLVQIDIMMCYQYFHDVRTTLTLDDDVAAKLKAAARRSGRSFREVVNDTLRRGLMTTRTAPRQAFRISPRSLGGVRAGVRIDNIGALLEQVEGPQHR